MKMGELYKEMGFINSGHTVQATRADLVGQYIGHTGPKTKEMITKSFGGILFIDEAYGLYKEDSRDYGSEVRLHFDFFFPKYCVIHNSENWPNCCVLIEVNFLPNLLKNFIKHRLIPFAGAWDVGKVHGQYRKHRLCSVPRRLQKPHDPHA